MEKLNQLISTLNLVPHPEGGYFRETYRSGGVISGELPYQHFSGKRNFSTCIYFLLTSESFSAFHRIRQDEIWHFYDGSPIKLHMMNTAGEYSVSLIGRDFDRGEVPQYVVPAGNWFAAEVDNTEGFSLVGCTVAPGFDFEDFELADRNELLSEFPDLENVILKLTRD
jgi:uncharacterized protein